MSEADSGCIESSRVQVDIDYIIISTLYIPSIPGESGHCQITARSLASSLMIRYLVTVGLITGM